MMARKSPVDKLHVRFWCIDGLVLRAPRLKSDALPLETDLPGHGQIIGAVRSTPADPAFLVLTNGKASSEEGLNCSGY